MLIRSLERLHTQETSMKTPNKKKKLHHGHQETSTRTEETIVRADAPHRDEHPEPDNRGCSPDLNGQTSRPGEITPHYAGSETAVTHLREENRPPGKAAHRNLPLPPSSKEIRHDLKLSGASAVLMGTVQTTG